MVREYKLRDLIRDYKLLSEDEVAFVNHDARLDFLLYSKIDKTPILAIEVDGSLFTIMNCRKNVIIRKIIFLKL